MGNYKQKINVEMKSFAFASIFAAANALSTIELEYMQYLAQFNKMTNDVDEFNFRMGNWAIVEEFIKENNAGNETHVPATTSSPTGATPSTRPSLDTAVVREA